jgi:hypothetical protein
MAYPHAPMTRAYFAQTRHPSSREVRNHKAKFLSARATDWKMRGPSSAGRPRVSAKKLTIEASRYARRRRIRRAGLASGESDSGLFSPQSLTPRKSCGERRFACGWTRRAVARIPQITSLDPAGARGNPTWISFGGDASCQRVLRGVRNNHVSETCKGKVETECPSSKASSIPGTIRSR